MSSLSRMVGVATLGLLPLANPDALARASDAVSPSLARAGLAPQNFFDDLADHSTRKQILASLRKWEKNDDPSTAGGDTVYYRPLEGPLQMASGLSPEAGAPRPTEPFDWTVTLPQMGAEVLNKASEGIALPKGMQQFPAPDMVRGIDADNEGAWMGVAHETPGSNCKSFPRLTPPAEGPQPDSAKGFVCDMTAMDPTYVDGPPITAHAVDWLRVSHFEGRNVKTDYRVEGGVHWKGLYTGTTMGLNYLAQIDLEGPTSLSVTVNFPENDCRANAAWGPLASLIRHPGNPSRGRLVEAGLSLTQDEFAEDPSRYLDLLANGAYKHVITNAHVGDCAPETYQTVFPTDPAASLVTLARFVTSTH